MKHNLKVYPQFFKALWCGDKTFEVRLNDRQHDGYTWREINGVIIYLASLEQKSNYVVFSFRETHRSE